MVVKYMTPDFGSSKATAFSSPHVKEVSTASSSSLALLVAEVPSVIRQISAMYDGQVMFWFVCQSSVKGGVR
jgi:hypothetical protein